MTYEKINDILLKYYNEFKEEPSYLIIPIDDFYSFTSNYGIGAYENILTISSMFGNIYLEGKEDINEAIIIA